MEAIENYILSHISPEDEYLHQLYRATNLHLLRPRMASGHIQGSLLKMLTALLQPKNVLEIGTFSGYSSLCIASALREESKLYTFEINDEQEDFTREWIDNSPYKNRIEFVIGDVLQLLPKYEISFQMAFIDGNKREYKQYYDIIFPKIELGGLIIFDNTLWSGRVVDEQYKDSQTNSIRTFNDFIATERRVESVIIPIRDGLTLLRKIHE